jgi:hypothetical protein
MVRQETEGRKLARRAIIDSEKLLEMVKAGKSQKECAEFFKVSIVAISKKLKRVNPPLMPKSFEKLTAKQKKFVLEKASGKTATQAALNTHEVSSRKIAKDVGAELMTNPKIKVALQDLLDLHLPQEDRIKRLKHWIDHNDPTASLKALDLSWKLGGDYAPEKHEVVRSYKQEVNELHELLNLLAEVKRAYSETQALQGTPVSVIEGEIIGGAPEALKPEAPAFPTALAERTGEKEKEPGQEGSDKVSDDSRQETN